MPIFGLRPLPVLLDYRPPHQPGFFSLFQVTTSVPFFLDVDVLSPIPRRKTDLRWCADLSVGVGKQSFSLCASLLFLRLYSLEIPPLYDGVARSASFMPWT